MTTLNVHHTIFRLPMHSLFYLEVMKFLFVYTILDISVPIYSQYHPLTCSSLCQQEIDICHTHEMMFMRMAN